MIKCFVKCTCNKTFNIEQFCKKMGYVKPICPVTQILPLSLLITSVHGKSSMVILVERLAVTKVGRWTAKTFG